MNSRLLLFSCLTISAAALAETEEEAKEAMISGTRANLSAYDVITAPKADIPVMVNVKLGETTSNFKDEVYDGIRITAPDDVEGRDLVWYFNVPGNWSTWYIVPVSGDFGRGFRNFMRADRLYAGLDKPQEKNRMRVLQSLDSSYFKPGGEYILWFRREKSADDAASDMRAVFRFVARPKADKEWNRESVEKALKLKNATPADQVADWNSRGGRILLDTALFDPADASSRIRDVLFSIRQTTYHSGGVYVSVESSCKPCKRTPTLAAIVEKYGPADFVQTSTELRKVDQQAGNNGRKEEPSPVTTHYYDYFAFEVVDADADGKVREVKTHSTDFSQLKPPAKGGFFATMPMRSVTVLYQDGKEVGRFYYFMQGSLEPLCIQEPPVGKYTNDNVTLEYQGGGIWVKQAMENGRLSYRAPYAGHRLNGLAEGFYPDGKLQFKVPYKDGELHGEGFQYSEDGKVIDRRRFIEGRQVGDDEKNAPRKGPVKAAEPKSKPKPL
ncbi:toxin-antitoxin system YwqK family antitoxin [Prosthecobacter sp.]|uniref:toxin-antitoxin system YwqK family antitoxin n=1 Tax=Prosthecobacter sp. TaxID=1965333 RepID=UPI003782E9C6